MNVNDYYIKFEVTSLILQKFRLWRKLRVLLILEIYLTKKNLQIYNISMKTTESCGLVLIFAFQS